MKKFRDILQIVLVCLSVMGGFETVGAIVPGASLSPVTTPVGRPNVRLYTDQDGIPQNKVFSLERDHDGFLWVGTGNGVAYFNGLKWKPIELPNATASNGVRTMLCTADGSLWFGTVSGGLHRLKDGRWTTFDKAGGTLPNDRIRVLLETKRSDGTNELWVGTGGGGLVRFDGVKWTLFNRANSGLPDDNVECLCRTMISDGTPVLWVGTGMGLAWFSGNAWKVFTTKNSGLQTDRIGGLLETAAVSGEKALWIGTFTGGLTRLVGDKWETFTPANSPILNTSVHRLAPAKSATGGHAFWAGTPGGGVFKYDDGKWTLYNRANTTLPDDAVDAIRAEMTPDGLELVWVGLFNSGLIRLSEDGFRTLDTRNSGLPTNIITSMIETTDPSGKHARWFGTDGGGVARLTEDGQWTVFDMKSAGLPSNQIYGFAEHRSADGSSGVWIATNDGLVRFEGDRVREVFTTKNSGLPGDQIYAVCEESRSSPGTSSLWVGTFGAGLARLSDGKWTTFTAANSGLQGVSIRAFLPVTFVGKPALAVATRGHGVSIFCDGKWTNFTRANSRIPNNDVEGLLEMNDRGRSVLVVGTLGGVVQIPLGRPDPPVEPLFGMTSPALTSPVISKLERIDDDLYVFSLKGVTRFRARPDGYDVRQFTSDDGLPSNAVTPQAAMADSTGMIWVGTANGLAALASRRVSTQRTTTAVRLENTLVNGQPLELAEQAGGLPPGPRGLGVGGRALRYSQNNLVFEYAMPEELKGGDARFRVQLKGFEDFPSGWTTDTRKEYTNLGPGNYVFTVWGRDAGGNESKPFEVAFSIHPAPWRTWWAYAGYFLLAGGALYLGVQARLRTLRARNLMLESRIAERTSELAEKNGELLTAKDELEARNLEMARKNEELNLAKVEVERKNAALDKNLAELARKNDELVKSQQQANRIFSALAEALPGTVLDEKYRLDFRIGSGGFGVVFRGTHVTLNRPIAIKVFRPQPGNDSPEALERFQREGMSACRINHPNAVVVIDSGVSADGIAYLVMELLNGFSLADEVRRIGKFSPGRCAEILGPVCEVLEAAHLSGVIHRDIKPDNIFLHQTTGGEIVKVVDFGVAKLMEDDGSGGGPLTGFGGIVGTAHYIAPERINSLPYDGRSDVYSVGVMLYQLLTGEMPYDFSESGFVSIALKHLTQTPRGVRVLRPDLSRDIEWLVMRTLAKRPNERPTAGELATLLRETFIEKA